MFQGFTQGAVDFLWGIRFNNERSWFLAHKEEYRTLVEQPLRELGDQVHQAMEELYPELGLNLHVSRIYRDARRLYGRGPYKDHLWFTLRRPREEWVSLPAFYFEIAPEYYSFGMGCYDATPATMAKLRARIDRDPKPVEQLAREAEDPANGARPLRRAIRQKVEDVIARQVLEGAVSSGGALRLTAAAGGVEVVPAQLV